MGPGWAGGCVPAWEQHPFASSGGSTQPALRVHRPVTSPTTTARGESPSMEPAFLMRTSNSSMRGQVSKVASPYLGSVP